MAYEIVYWYDSLTGELQHKRFEGKYTNNAAEESEKWIKQVHPRESWIYVGALDDWMWTPEFAQNPTYTTQVPNAIRALNMILKEV